MQLTSCTRVCERRGSAHRGSATYNLAEAFIDSFIQWVHGAENSQEAKRVKQWQAQWAGSVKHTTLTTWRRQQAMSYR